MVKIINAGANTKLTKISKMRFNVISDLAWRCWNTKKKSGKVKMPKDV